jgi:hypothetical protein
MNHIIDASLLRSYCPFEANVKGCKNSILGLCLQLTTMNENGVIFIETHLQVLQKTKSLL